MTEEIGKKQILWAAINRKVFCPVIVGGVIAFLFSDLMHLELVSIFSDTEAFYYFLSSAIIQGIIGVAAFTVAAVTLFPPSHSNQHPQDPEEFEWWTRTNLTELAFFAFLLVFISLLLPFIGQFLHDNRANLFISNWLISIVILMFISVLWKAARLIRRTAGYNKKHLD